jgi:hypothetical protein
VTTVVPPGATALIHASGVLVIMVAGAEAAPRGGTRPLMGYWRATAQSWWETTVVNCALCRQMIPRDRWVSEEGLSFCVERCEALDRDCRVPRHGPKIAPTGPVP